MVYKKQKIILSNGETEDLIFLAAFHKDGTEKFKVRSLMREMDSRLSRHSSEQTTLNSKNWTNKDVEDLW